MNRQPRAGDQLLLVDDDEVFRQVLGAALRRRGLQVASAASIGEALDWVAEQDWDWAVVDLKLPDGSGLEVVERLHASCSPRTLVLTGYASIATAVEAVKLGALDYLPKPATVNQILAALSQQEASPRAEVSSQPPSLERLEWEHIQRVLQAHDGNISATARALNMHRRTLQRKLAKRPVAR